jgi:hypothetical protein
MSLFIDSVAEDTHVWVIDAAGNGAHELTMEQDLRARSPRWSADGKGVYYLANDHGCTTIFQVGIEARPAERLALFVLDGGLTASFDSEKAVTLARGAQTFQVAGFSEPGEVSRSKLSQK